MATKKNKKPAAKPAKAKKKVKAAAKSSPAVKAAKKGQTMTYRARPAGNAVSKPRRGFGDPSSSPKPNPDFVIIPSDNKQPADLTYDLANGVDPGIVSTINSSGQMVFFSVGDTGDINGTGITKDLADQMETLYNAATPASRPAFLYHLGDVVYYNGESTDYRDQFYDPYKYLPVVIFAIAGNHDGQTIINKGDPPDPEPSLTGFFDNFCDDGKNPSQSSPYRKTLDQPWPYWVLETPLATFIGLYSNVDGSLDKYNDTSHPQYNWFVNQLKAADKNKALILSVHHCPFSLDSDHGGYVDIMDAIDQAVAAAGGRYPDLVLSGHVHNYQRFSRTIGNKSHTYIVAGAGGYASLKTMHHLQVNPQNKAKITTPFKTTMAGVTLQSYNQDLPGFLRLTVTKQTIKGEYFINTTAAGDQSTTAFDTFTVQL
jgi:hypothetical protein